MGLISECTDLTYETKIACLEAGYEWVAPPNNHDNIFSSMLTFFEISTLEMWPDNLYRAIDSASEVDHGPVLNNKPYMAILYIIFIFVTTFFVMNLFISVIVSKFNEEKMKTEGSAGLSEEQREWVKIQRYMVEVAPSVVPQEPKDCFRKNIFKIV